MRLSINNWRLSRRVVVVLHISVIALVGILAACRNTSSARGAPERPNAPVVVPVSPFLFEYQRWDDHVIQWLDGDYETLELLKKDGASGPILWVFLTERTPVHGSKRQIHYVNDAELARTLSLSASDREVHLTSIQVEQLATPTVPRFRLSLDAKVGRIAWDFQAQGAPSAQHGGRLVDAAGAAHDLKGGLLALYVEKSAVAAQGTHVTIGDRDLAVAAWPEISRPPHFVAYRGVHSAPAHIGYFPAIAGVRVGLEGAPPDYRDGAEWRYRWRSDSGSGPVARDLRVGLRVAPEGTWRFSAPNFEQSITLRNGLLEMTELAGIDRGERASIRFEPPLPDLVRSTDGRHTSRFALTMAGDEALVSGTFSFSKSGQRVTGELRPEVPQWAATLAMQVGIVLGRDGYTYTSATSYPNMAH
jgi:hypothetical protein